jgi:hypothetical protein
VSAGEADGCYLCWSTHAPGARIPPTRAATAHAHTCLLDAGHDRPGPAGEAPEDHACTCGATYPAALESPERLRRQSG